MSTIYLTSGLLAFFMFFQSFTIKAQLIKFGESEKLVHIDSIDYKKKSETYLTKIKFSAINDFSVIYSDSEHSLLQDAFKEYLGFIIGNGLRIRWEFGEHLSVMLSGILSKSFIDFDNYWYSFRLTEQDRAGSSFISNNQGRGSYKQRSINFSSELALLLKPFKKTGFGIIGGISTYISVHNDLKWSTEQLERSSITPSGRVIAKLEPKYDQVIEIKQSRIAGYNAFFGLNFQIKRFNFIMKLGELEMSYGEDAYSPSFNFRGLSLYYDLF